MKQRFELLKRLDGALDQSQDENGENQASYKDGLTDAIIAKELGIAASTVSGTRRSVFGNFPFHARVELQQRGKESETISHLRQEISELRTRVRFLEKSLGIDSEQNPT